MKILITKHRPNIKPTQLDAAVRQQKEIFTKLSKNYVRQGVTDGDSSSVADFVIIEVQLLQTSVLTANRTKVVRWKKTFPLSRANLTYVRELPIETAPASPILLDRRKISFKEFFWLQITHKKVTIDPMSKSKYWVAW
jgi:hypothetical protein